MNGLVRLVCLLGATALVGCGGGSTDLRRSAELRAHVTSSVGTIRNDAARRARAALDAAVAAYAQGRGVEGDELASVARAWAETAALEHAVEQHETELAAMEVEAVERAAEARVASSSADESIAERQAQATALAAQDELVRALRRAEAEEASPRRARRLSLDSPAQILRFAQVIESRARVLLAAARALGASREPTAAALRALDAIASASDPLEKLAASDRAYAAAQLALGDARRRAGERPSDEEIVSLVEALRSEGFEVQRDERGLGARFAEIFRGTDVAPSRRGELRRLGRLLSAHPFGPVVLVVETASDDQRARAQADRRLASLRRALLPEGGREVVPVAASVGGARGPNVAYVLLAAYVTPGPGFETSSVQAARDEAPDASETANDAGE